MRSSPEALSTFLASQGRERGEWQNQKCPPPPPAPRTACSLQRGLALKGPLSSWRVCARIPQGQGAVCFAGRWAPGSVLLHPVWINVNSKRLTEMGFTVLCRAGVSPKSRELSLSSGRNLVKEVERQASPAALCKDRRGTSSWESMEGHFFSREPELGATDSEI